MLLLCCFEIYVVFLKGIESKGNLPVSTVLILFWKPSNLQLCTVPNKKYYIRNILTFWKVCQCDLPDKICLQSSAWWTWRAISAFFFFARQFNFLEVHRFAKQWARAEYTFDEFDACFENHQENTAKWLWVTCRTLGGIPFRYYSYCFS